MQLPTTQYARSGDVNLAYQVMGDGDCYLIFITGWVSNIEEAWNIPQLAAWLRYLSTFSRLVIFDKRGTGLSDRVSEHDLPNLEQRARDVLSIIEAVGAKQVALLGLSEGGPMAIWLAARYPQKISHLLLLGSFARWIKTDNYPYGLTQEMHEETKKYIFEHWGEPIGLQLMAPSAKDDALTQQQWATFLRRSASPATAKMFYEMNMQIDVRDCLEKINIPTLIIHRKDDRLIECGHSRYLHDHIHGSQVMLTDGVDHFPWFSPQKAELVAMQTFLTGQRAVMEGKLRFLNTEEIFVLYAVRDYLLQHYDKDISIQMLSRHFGINEFKIKTGFKTLFEKPVISFLTEVRLEKACELLNSPGYTITRVAGKVGYQHANNFSVAFKRKYGVTPQQYKTKIDR